MPRAERIIFTFAALGKTGKSSALAQGADAFASSRQNLMGISLMADVPDDDIFGRIKNVMKRDR